MAGIKIVAKHKVNDDFLMIELPKSIYKQKLMEILKNADEKCDGFISVEVNRPYKKRTTGDNSQNNLFWKLCTIIANEVGDDSEGMKDTENGIKMRALSKGYPFHVSKITGEKIPESMTKINTVECSYLIDTAYMICSELGIMLEPELVKKEPVKIVNDVYAEKMADSEIDEIYGGGLF